MLRVLNLQNNNLTHYYENRDDGLYHIIRGLNEAALNEISSKTHFEKDTSRPNDLPMIALKQELLTKSDIDALQLICPGMTVSNKKAETVTYEAKTIIKKQEKDQLGVISLIDSHGDLGMTEVDDNGASLR